TVRLRDHEIRGDERDPAPQRLAEEPVGFGMVLVSPAPERDPGAAIDEQAPGSGGDASGTGPATRQRTSPRGSARSARSGRAEARRCPRSAPARGPRGE